MFDQITIDRIELMHPSIKEQLTKDYLEINKNLPKGVRLRFTQTLRTKTEQDGLYALGRTKVNVDGKSSKKPLGNIVTNSKGEQSIHIYGLAFDIVIMLQDSNEKWDITWKRGEYHERVENFFKKKGWTWGGEFKSFKDYPHFEYTHGNSWRYYANLPNDKKGYPVL